MTASSLRPAASRRALATLVLPALLLLATSSAGAQELAVAGSPAAAVGAPSDAAPCDYARCALAIAPRWNGLAVVRGSGGPAVANLHFFLPRDVSAALAGSDPAASGADSAMAAARRALRLRRAGAALTDASGALVATAAIAALSAGRGRRGNDFAVGAAGAGAALFALSVPFQFAADGALSRAVWWHNARYAGR